MKKTFLSLFTVCLIFISCKTKNPTDNQDNQVTNAQTNFYTFNTDSIFSEESVRSAYDTLTKRLPDHITLNPIIYHKVVKNDSIINYLDFLVSNGTVSLFNKLLEKNTKPGDEKKIDKANFEFKFQQDSLFLLLNKKLPEFTLKDLNGIEFSSNQLIGKPALINYWSIYCKPCVEEIPDLNNLKEKYGNQMNFIAITESACSEGEIESFLKRKSFDFKILTLGDDYKETLKIQAIPVNIFIDENGIIRHIQKNYPMDDRPRKQDESIPDNNYFVRIIEEMIK